MVFINLETQQKEQSSMMFMNQFPSIHQNCPVINPMGIGASWSNAYLERQQKEQYYVMFIKLIAKNSPKIDKLEKLP